MSVGYGSPLTSANTNASFVSRTQDTDMVGKLDNLNTTDSTTTASGAIHTAGGLGVEKKAHINQVFVDSLAGQKAVVTSATKEIIESIVSSTELESLSGINSNVQDQLDLKAFDSDVVHNTGNETVAGIKTFSDDTNFQQDVVIDGDLTVHGTTTTINTATLEVEDANIVINNGGNDATAEGAGITVERTGTNGSLIYQDSLASKFKSGALGSESEIITAVTTQSITGEKTFNNANFNAQFTFAQTNNTTLSGASALLPTPTTTIRVTNAGLTSISSLDDVSSGKVVIVTNRTGSAIVFENNNGTPATKGILTGTGNDLTVEDDASVWLSYDATAGCWYVIGGSGGGGVQKQEVPAGAVDGVNDTFTLSFTPNSADSVSVYVDGVVREKSKWSLIGNSVIFTAGNIPALGQKPYVVYSTGSGGGGGGSVNAETQYFTLGAGDITAKKVTLAAAPVDGTVVLLDLIGGSAQEYSVDFIVTGSDVDWNGLALDGFLSAGDKLRVHYYT